MLTMAISLIITTRFTVLPKVLLSCELLKAQLKLTESLNGNI